MDEEKITEDMVKEDLEEAEEFDKNCDRIIANSLDDFSPFLKETPESKYAAEVANAYITSQTREGHRRISEHFIVYVRSKYPGWNPKIVDENTPHLITSFISSKCAPIEKGGQGNRFATAVATRAALTFFYKNLRPHESMSSWFQDTQSKIWHGLPTRSRAISEFMIGLEKTKAKQGEVSRSARAIGYEEMIRLYHTCLEAKGLSQVQLNQGAVRYSVYLFAWLLMLRIDEVLKLKFENLNMVHPPEPNKLAYVDIYHEVRKHAPTGDPHCYRVHANDRRPEICPIRALIRLSQVYGPDFDPTGPLFLFSNPKGLIEAGHGLTTSAVTRSLAIDFQKVGDRNWVLYSTHSFRRGGCQHRLRQDWTLGAVAAWGGWSQQEATTMYRYIYSPRDNHSLTKDYDRNDSKRPKIKY